MPFSAPVPKLTFSPVNGLFLTGPFKDVLDRGFLALVPDVDLELRDSYLPYADLAE